MSLFELEEAVINPDQTWKFGGLHLYCDAEQSSFEEVAGTCPNKDDPDMRCLTVRSFTIGLIFVIGMSYIHMWLYSVAPTPLIHPVLVILVSHFLGKIWSLIPWSIVGGGPWTIKEHTVVLIMGNIAWMFFRVYSFATITYLQYRERQPTFKFIYSFLIIIAVQFLGFGLAGELNAPIINVSRCISLSSLHTFLGVFRRFLVWSSGSVWPINFPYIALLRILHERPIKEVSFRNNIKQNLWQRFVSNQLAFFGIITVIQFIFCWFPYFIMPVLGAFSWMCMIKPTNYLLSQLTGYYGLSMGSLSFNWFTLTWTLGSPMVVPRWAIMNIAVGFVLATWVITPIIYFTNVWNTYDHPIAEVTRSSSNWSALGLVSTAAAFANLSAVLVHMFLHHSKNLWKELRSRSLNEKGNDVHCRLIALYPDVPDWWFFVVSVLAFIVIVVVGQVSHIIPWYKTFFSLVIPIALVLPFAMVASITGQSIQNPSVYYLLVIIASSLWVDDKSTMLAFVTIGYSTYCQTLQLVTNMKLGHYMKIAPRTLFLAHVVACLVTPSLSIGIQYYYFKKEGFITNNTASVATGTFESTNVGDAINNQTKFFGSTNWKNRNLLWALLIGAILPIPFWLASRQWKWCHLIHIPLMLTFISWMPLVSAGALFTWLLIGISTTFFFNKLYWKRHVYLTSSALNAGFYLCWLIIDGPLVQYGINFPSWWGFGGVNKDGCPLSLLNTTAFSVSFEN